MSQTALLENIVAWSAEECRQNVHSVLPSLFKQLQERSDNFSDVLQLLCQSFVPVIELDQIDQHLFQTMMSQVTIQFDYLFQNIEETVADILHQADAIEKIIFDLQILHKIIDSLELCITALVEKPGGIKFASVHSMPPAIIHCITSSYIHCKESSNIYGDALGFVSEQLTCLFKKTHNLEMNFVALLDKLSISSNEQDILCLCSVIQGLYSISQIAISLDVKIMISMWKSISRLACQNKSLLIDHLDISPLLEGLADHITSSYEYLCQLIPENESGADQQTFIRNVKILGFEMKVLVTLIKEYDGLHKKCIFSIYTTLLVIQKHRSLLESEKNVSAKYYEELEKQVTIAVEPLIITLLDVQYFMYAVTKEEQDLSDDLCVPRCLTILMILDQLPLKSEKVQSEWMEPKIFAEDESRTSIFIAMFKAVQKCYLQLQQPICFNGAVAKGKTQRKVALYQHICTHLSTFGACCTKEHFTFLERCLLEQVLCRNSFCASLAIDVWSFLARYGTAELCRDQVMALTDLLSSTGLSNTPECIQLTLLLSRLIKFLAPDHQTELVNAFPPEKHMELWCVLPISSLSSSARDLTIQNLFSSCISQLQDWSSAHEKFPSKAQNLIYCIGCICNVYDNQSLSYDDMKHSWHEPVLKMCLEICNIDVDSVLQNSLMQSLISKMLQFVACLSPVAESEQMLKALKWTKIVLSENPDMTFKLAILDLLISCRKTQFHTSPQVISDLFAELLSEKNCLIRQITLEAFSQFAEDTPHEYIVPQSLNDKEAVRELVVNYLNQVVSADGNEVDMKTIITQSRISEKYSLLSAPQLYPSTKQQSDIADKRNLDEVCCCLERDVVQLEKIHSQDHQCSDSLKQKLNKLGERIKTLSDYKIS